MRRSTGLKFTAVLLLTSTLLTLWLAGSLTGYASPNRQATGPAPVPATTAAPRPGAQDKPLVNPCTGQPFNTILTSDDFSGVEVQPNETGDGSYVLSFSLPQNERTKRFSDF